MSSIIYNDNEIIGRIDDIEKYIRNELKKQLDDWSIEADEIIENTKSMMYIIAEIRENEQEAYNDDALFRIYEHPMGGYEYKVLVEKSVK